MPINTVMAYTKAALDGLILPDDMGVLQAFIVPFNPNEETEQPGAYIWGSRGDEVRLDMPRAQPLQYSTGANKTMTHQLDVWLVWFGADASDPNSDTEFPSVIDAVMWALRNVALKEGGQYATDPVTGQQSALLTFGENMSWIFGTVRATADQRQLRFDAQITCEVVEVIQA